MIKDKFLPSIMTGKLPFGASTSQSDKAMSISMRSRIAKLQKSLKSMNAIIHQHRMYNSNGELDLCKDIQVRKYKFSLRSNRNSSFLCGRRKTHFTFQYSKVKFPNHFISEHRLSTNEGQE